MPELKTKGGTASGMVKSGGGMALVGLMVEIGLWPTALMGPIALAVAFFFASQISHKWMPWMDNIFGGRE